MKRSILLTTILAAFVVAGVARADVIKQTNARYVVVQGEAADEILNPDAKTDRWGKTVRERAEDPPSVYTVADDEKASDGKALVSPKGGHNKPDEPLESIAAYRIQMTTAGTYTVYVRARNNGTPKHQSSDSFFAPDKLGKVSPNVTIYVQNSGEYKWQKLPSTFLLLPSDIVNPIEFRVGAREADTRIDAFVFSRDTGLDKTPEKLDEMAGVK